MSLLSAQAVAPEADDVARTVAEIVTVNLVFIMLAAGAVAGGVVSLVTDSLVVQSLAAAVCAWWLPEGE